MKTIATYNLPFYLILNTQQQAELRRKLNLHWLGDESPNQEVRTENTTMFVGKYDDHPNFKACQDAHANIYRSFNFWIDVDVMEDGTLRISCDEEHIK